MLATQKYIKEKGLESLVSKFKLKLKEYDTKILLKYNQIESRDFKTHPCVKECRGLILAKDTYEVLSLPFYRFFNLGEEKIPEMDWESTLVQNKQDGSLMALYWDFTTNKWCVQTSGSAEAEVPVPANAYNYTFAEAFWLAANTHGFDIDHVNKYFDKKLIYVFEFQSPFNQVVVKHDNPNLILLTVRNQTSLQEVAYSQLKEVMENVKINVPIVKAISFFNFSSLDNIVEHVNNQNGSNFEGFVLVDKNFNRLKIKNKEYVQYSLLNDVFNKAKGNKLFIVELILKGEEDEYLSVFPQHTKMVLRYKNQLKTIETKILSFWKRIQKEFKLYSDKDIKFVVRKSYAMWLKSNLPEDLQFAFGLYMGILDGKEMAVWPFLTGLNRKILNTIIEV